MTTEVFELLIEPLLVAQQALHAIVGDVGREFLVHPIEGKQHFGATNDATDDDVVHDRVGGQHRFLRQVADAQVAAGRAQT